MPCALDPGDLEIAVEWFQRDVSGGDERRIFRAWAAHEESGVGSWWADCRA